MQQLGRDRPGKIHYCTRGPLGGAPSEASNSSSFLGWIHPFSLKIDASVSSSWREGRTLGRYFSYSSGVMGSPLRLKHLPAYSPICRLNFKSGTSILG